MDRGREQQGSAAHLRECGEQAYREHGGGKAMDGKEGAQHTLLLRGEKGGERQSWRAS